MTSNARICPICESGDIRFVLEVPNTPVLCNVLWPSRAEALAAPRGDIRLNFCIDCGHVFNEAFDPTLLYYTAGYENSLHFSARFRAYADELAEGLIERFDLRGRDIVEVGCGQGDFLRLICARGPNRGVGFDPSHRGESGSADTGAGVTFVTDVYDERYAHLPVDFLCCRHVLEHIQRPVAFLESIRRTIGEERSAGLFFEVPDVAYTLRDLAVWDLIYEHCSYFSHASLTRLFADRGMKVERTYGTFGGQFLCIEACVGRGGSAAVGNEASHQERLIEEGTRKGGRKRHLPKQEREGRLGSGRVNSGAIDDIVRVVEDFPARYREKVDSWRETFGRIRNEGRRAVLWGAGSKGVSILNVLRDDRPADFIVDLNPRKHGMHVSGTGQQIVSPDFLREYRPDVIVGMNAIYASEISAKLADLGVEAELVFA